jgi:addiction module HigA family antidote
VERPEIGPEGEKSPMATHDFANFAAPAPHPGEHLREDYLPVYDLSAGALAKAMGLKDRSRIERLVREKQSITADTALRLAKVFGTSPQYWINLQTTHDLSKAAIEGCAELERIEPLHAPATRC